MKNGRVLNRTTQGRNRLYNIKWIAFAVLTFVMLPATPTFAKETPPQQIVPLLKGLSFVPTPQDVKKAGVNQPGINISAVKLLDDDFQQEMSAYLEHPFTMKDLDAVTHRVVAYYRDHNHPLVDVVAPVQDVESGVVQIVVTEFKVGEVRASGNKWFSDRVITAPITLHHGDEIDDEKLINQLDAANTNPFRRVNLVYQPAAEQGYTDLVLQTEDRFPVNVFAGFDNSGLPVTGRNRWNFGATWGNGLWCDQQISYQFSASTNFLDGGRGQTFQPRGASFAGQSLTWSIPVNGRDSVVFSGSYDRSVPNVGQDFGLLGRSGQVSFRYNLALRRTGSLIHTLQIGYDFKTTNNNLQFGGTLVSRTNAEIDQFPVTYAANLTDKWGSSALTTSLYFSPGNITPDNNDKSFQPAQGQSGRPLASARYIYWRSDFTRLTKLPGHTVWASRFMGQTSTSNLLYTEQLAGGGSDILRGYDPSTLLGDHGVIVSNELRSPVLSRGKSEGTFLKGSVQAFGFWDWGHFSAEHAVQDVTNHLNASSTGVGVIYKLRANISAKSSYGWQLQHIPGTGDRDHLLNFSLITAY